MTKKSDIDLGQSALHRRWKIGPVGLTWLAIALVTVVFSSASFVATNSDPASWQRESPHEGYSWVVARYQIEFNRLRLDLHVAGRGNQTSTSLVSHDVRKRISSLKKIGDELAAHTNMLSLPRELSDAVEAVLQVQSKVEKAVDRPDSEATKFLAALVELETVDGRLTALSERVAEAESKLRADSIKGLQERVNQNLAILALGYVLFIGVILLLSRLTRSKHLLQKQEIAALRGQKKALHDKDIALQQKSRFMSGVSHELRSCLQVIGVSIDALEDSRLAGDEAVPLGRIKRATTSLARQLLDLETIIRGEAGKLEIHPGAFEANDMLTDLAAEHQRAAADKDVQLVVTLPPYRTFVVADVVRIRQILNNLISNAVKYTQSGAVTVSLKRYDPAIGRLCFVVADTGPGIPQSALGSIFEPFERLGSAQARANSSGIGLAVVQTVAKSLGATIRPTSSPGFGTRFEVDIPASPQRPQDTVDLASAATVLFVDDKTELLTDLVELASMVQIDADTAASAAFASNLLATRRYDLVFVDLDMPGKGGRELAVETRNGKGLNSKSCLIAFSASDRRDIGESWPFDGFVQKPLSRAALRKLVEQPPAASREMPTLRAVAGKRVA